MLRRAKMTKNVFHGLVVYLLLVITLAEAQTPISCATKQMAASMSRRILPACVRGEPVLCDEQVNQVVVAIGLPVLCGVTSVAREEGQTIGRLLSDSNENTSVSPSILPSTAPTKSPSIPPFSAPSTRPSESPSYTPGLPFTTPSLNPSVAPYTYHPSNTPSWVPSETPSNRPSETPSRTPSTTPSTSRPSRIPSEVPTTSKPSRVPSEAPSSARPSRIPSLRPTFSRPSGTPSTAKPSFAPTKPRNLSPSISGVRFFVSPSGNDSNVGTDRSSPLATIQRALTLIRASSGSPRAIILMTGKHRVTSTINFGSSDSGINIIGEIGAVVTAAVSLSGLNWVQKSQGVYSVVIPPNILSLVDDLGVLSYNGEPMIRARYPNLNKYTDYAWAPQSGISQYTSRTVQAPITRVVDVAVVSGVTAYRDHRLGTGGSCTGIFEPPSGYYCAGIGEAEGTCAFSRLVQATFSPTISDLIKPSTWSRLGSAHFHALHYVGWGGWSFKVRAISGSTMDLGEGGFQEARGDCGKGGGDWFIDNVPELLDYPNEFYLNKDTGLLTMKMPQGATLNPNNVEMELGSSAVTLFKFAGGSSSNPIIGINVTNIQFERTSPNFMKPHEMPSGGDWAITRSGALFFQNARDINVVDCTFTKIGSHGIFLSNHIRAARITRNVFHGIDGTCVAMVGDPKFNSARPWDRTNDLDYVSGVVIEYNMMSNMGLMLLQSAGIFGSIATNVLAYRNVIFEGPRAGIVYNDLFGNNLVTRENILFNMVTMTQDHGPYNVWDRQQWLLPPRFKSAPNIVDRNIMFGTSYGWKLVDLDDGARSHVVTNNVLVDGYIKFKGGLASASRNVIIIGDRQLLPTPLTCLYITTAIFRNPRFSFTGNTCFGPGPGGRVTPYAWAFKLRKRCKSGFIATSNNYYYGISQKFGKCGARTAVWKRKRQDRGSLFLTLPAPLDDQMRACNALMVSFGI